ncbi:MAG: DUF2236 domain-containing protein [Alphaproteobacteria bacterium]|nr:DUF2236 domain-containing protein [Alphaproteobacteria bacterium]
MTPGPPALVTEADFEHELRIVRSSATGAVAGVFGPDTVIWRIDREAAVFLGAGRALLLQLAHPWIATAISQHSRSLTDPVGRFHRTFDIVFTMVFGTTDQALAAARRLHGRHAAIAGRLTEDAGDFPAGSPYRANDVGALRWVHATLTATALLSYELVCPPLAAEDRERYYAEMRLFAGLFGIPQSALPESWAGFTQYVEQMVGSNVLAVGEAARGVAAGLFAGAGTRWRTPFWYRALTASLMPPRLRDAFELPYGPSEQRSVGRALALLRLIYPRLPARVRYVAPYQEAVARLAGRSRPAPLTRALNRFWIGRGSMAIGGD